jgi:hypothetical protein
MKTTGTYVYCVVAAARRPAVKRTRGLAGTVRLIDHGRAGQNLKKWLVVSDVPLDRYGESAINTKLSDIDWVSRAAVAHEAVVESFSGAAAIVPMKLFTIFNDDARALDDLKAQDEVVNAALRRVRGRIELGVRVSLDRDRPQPPRSPRASTGVAYLAGKKAQRDRAAELARNAREVVADLYEELAAIAADAVRRAASELPAQGGPLLLDAAFLVPRTSVARFRKAVERRAKELAPDGYRVAMTGPWPAYSFVRD